MNWNTLMCEERIRMGQGNRKGSGSDYRTEFEKDYQRIISSASFRRLQDKTQVFPLDKNDFVRTRLTHSLEVANFARSIGRILGAKIISTGLDSDFTRQTQDNICAVLECAGLIHDIGNPPFGHFGEDAIQDWFKRNLPETEYKGRKLTDVLNKQQIQDFYHFEGNTQAVRVVTKLHFLVDEHGMNLTKALLATIMKYPGSSLEIRYNKDDSDRDIARKKMGYFYADAETFEQIQKSCGCEGRRHPLAFALEAADDIAYKTADIEDAVKKGLLSVAVLKNELGAALDAAKIMAFVDKENKDKAIETTKNLISSLGYYYDKATSNNYENPELYAVQNWIIRVQGMMLSQVVDAFIDNYDSIMSGTFKNELIAMTPGALIMDALGDIAYRYAFVSEAILKLEVAADAIFDFLLSGLVKALLYYDTDEWKSRATAVDHKMVGLISSSFMQTYRFYSEGLKEEDKLYLRLILATDYVSGMTDSYARRLYRELRGID